MVSEIVELLFVKHPLGHSADVKKFRPLRGNEEWQWARSVVFDRILNCLTSCTRKKFVRFLQFHRVTSAPFLKNRQEWL